MMDRVIACLLLTIGCALAGTPQYQLLGVKAGGYISVPENYSVNSTLFRIHASDSDPGDQLCLSPGDPLTTQYVKINPPAGNDVTFNVTLIKEFDYETTPTFTMKFVLTDKQHNRINIEINVYLSDVNDNTPVFTQHPYTWDIHEQPCNTAGPWHTFSSIHATDADNGANGQVTYSMEPKSEYKETKDLYSKTFDIDPASGVVHQRECVDYETNSYYQFIVTAKDGGPDGGLNTTVDFIIRVKDDQDTPPFFTRNSFRETIPEDIAKGQSITTVNAIDGDRGVSQKVQYTAASDCPGLYEINATTGVISTTKPLDRDQGIIFQKFGECVINVTASEIEEATNTQYNTTETSTSVTITISDVNDNVPMFTNGSRTARVKENTPPGVPVTFTTRLHVADIDQGQNAHMDISIRCMDSDDCTTFSVSPLDIQGSGDITVLVANNTLLDYETRETINITVIATEQENVSHLAVYNVTVNITDINDEDPTFVNTSYTLSMYENSGNGTSVGNITATDNDKSPEFNKLTYSIVGGNGKFTVNPATGEISTKCQTCNHTLDREIQDTYYFTYTATDEGERRDSVSIQVKLLDRNDNAPIFSRATYLVYKDENDSDLQVIKVEASDKDKTNTSNSKFHFDVSTTTDSSITSNLNITDDGWIRLTQPIDYEALSSDSQNTGVVNVTIMVRDDGNPTLSSTAIVQLTVQDVNDNNPVFERGNYHYTLLENATTTDINNAQIVGSVSATDADGSYRNSHINYLIQNGGADRFYIDYTSGMVKVRMNARFDRETQANYNLTILAIDQGSPPRNDSTTMFVEILDVNDENPVFASSSRQYTASIKEDAMVDKSFIQCTATDPDLDNHLNYSITVAEARDENGKLVNMSLVQGYFGIHPDNGSVYVKSKLDRETAETIVLTVLVIDVAAYYPSPQNDTATLTVTLLDVNDNPPYFYQTIYRTSIIENANIGTLLIQTTATDRDKNRTMSYKLDTSSPSFTINDTTGWISKTGDLDRETEPFVQLVVIATDNGVPDRSSSVTVNVTVEDFNDNPPVFTTRNTTVYIREDVPVGTDVIDIDATDADTGPNANVTFKLQENDKEIGYFAINATTGIISVNKPLDRETISHFSLLIVANDNPEDTKVQKTAQKSLVVKLNDVNDNAPVFSKESYTAEIVEDAKLQSEIIRITASDADIDQNKLLSYQIVSDNNLFNIDNNGAIKVNSSLVEKVGNYTVTVLAFDHGQPQLNGTTSVNISVLDVNLHNPVIHNIPQNHEIRVYECARKGTIIHTFTYTDEDKGDNARADFTMSELSGNSTHVFNMNTNGSLVVVAESLNAGGIIQYKFQVEATDRGKPKLKSEKVTITVSIVDVNDHLPSFRETEMRMTVKEDMTSVNAVDQVVAYDEDKDAHSCYTLDTTKQSNFIVEERTGKIYYNKSVDYETDHTVTFTVTVHDCSMEQNVSDYCDKTAENKIAVVNKDVHSTLKVIVDVIDVDDNPPVFLSRTLSTGMRRNTEPGTVLTLNLRNSSYIHDNDTAINGVLSWKFKNYGNITASENLRDKIPTDSGTEMCEDNIKHIFCITSNGTIVNNKYFSEDLNGYFIVKVKVWDNGGNDTADLIIYLISDSQVLSMNIRQNKEQVSQFKDTLLAELSAILGPYTAVFDNLQDHKENDQVSSTSSDLHFHVVKSDTQEVISGPEALRLLDSASSSSNKMFNFKNHYNIMTVSEQQTSSEQSTESSKKTFFILLAVSVSEALIISIVVYVSLVTKNKYQRKLKAANIKPTDMEMHIVEQEIATVPGSNVYAKHNNPLLNAQLEEKHFDALEENGSIVSGDVDSLNLDDNEVGDQHTVYDRIEEREVTLDMYGDDSRSIHNISSEDLLESALNYHQLKKSMESLDKIEDDYDDLDGYMSPGATNYAFDEDMESTEI